MSDSYYSDTSLPENQLYSAVEQPRPDLPDNLPIQGTRLVINRPVETPVQPLPSFTPVDHDPFAETPETLAQRRGLIDNAGSTGSTVVDRLTGFGGQERFQLWPEKMVRSAVTLPHDVMTGEAAPLIDPLTGELSGDTLGRVNDLAGMAGSATLFAKPGMGTLGSGAMRQAPKDDIAPIFYSAVENAVKNNTQSKMTGEQWLGTLANSKGVKPEELQWTGLHDFLTENKGQPVTKQQVEDFVASNKVELKEVNKFGKDAINKMSIDEIERLNSLGNPPSTKYEKWQLPGGENYREHLITLSDDTPKLNKIEDRMMELRRTPNGATTPEYRQLEQQQVNYKSSHWDEPNILAHVRVNDRMIDGKKSLHIEEIQSDWHQQGREKGYQGIDNFEIKRAELKSKMDELRKSKPAGLNAMDTLKWLDEQPEYVKMRNEFNSLVPDRSGENKVPDAPFKKTWHELALKRMIREAAEKGYDRLSWTPGEAQALRYPDEMRKAANSIDWHNKSMGKTDPSGSKQILIDMKDGSQMELKINKDGVVTNGIEKAKGKHLSDIIGKDMAKDIIDKDEGNIAGKDFVVGGEGMKGFYDQIIPKSLEKMGKEFGVKVKKYSVTPEEAAKNLKEFETSLNSKPMTPEQKAKWIELRDAVGNAKNGSLSYIDIPQGMKDTALKKGFPLFSAGVPLIPVDHDPWNDKSRLVPVDHDPFKSE